jgi:hypothetical protein
MPLPPLTHHEILELIGPFSSRGLRVDLDASDRLKRTLCFKPVEHPEAAPGQPALLEVLKLDNPYGRTFCLTRTLTPRGGGPPATLSAEGPDPGELLALVQSVTPASQFRFGEGFALAFHQQLEPANSRQLRLVLRSAEAQVGGLALSMRVPGVRSLPADLKVTDPAGARLELPEDLIAVLGWDWAPLVWASGEWRSKLRLRGKEPRRSRSAEQKAERTVLHLARTFAEPPSRFHERFVAARWGAVVRRLIPILACFAVVGASLLAPMDQVSRHPWLPLLLMNVPLLLIGLSFTLQESSRVELPPLPRPSPRPRWRNPTTS